MRALSLSTLIVFLFMLAAHLSWWKTSRAISSKIEREGIPIFSGPNTTQIAKLDRLSELGKKSSQIPETKQKTETPHQEVSHEARDLTEQLLSADVHLSELRHLTSSEDDHLLKKFAEQFSKNQEFDQATVRNIILAKGLSYNDPEAKSLVEILKRLQQSPQLRKENYTEVYFNIYETMAMEPKTYDNNYEMREALSRMDFKSYEIDEFEEGLYQEETQKY